MSIESTTNDTTSAPSNAREQDSLVDALFDTALGWADIGLETARTTLSHSASALNRTAKLLEVVRERLRT